MDSKIQVLNRKEVSPSVFKAVMKREIKESARDGAYQGVMDAKIENLLKDSHENVDYNKKHMPLTTEEFEKFVKKQNLIKIGLVALAVGMGFIDLKDGISFIFGLV